jgi:hypothetical protein
VRLSQNKQASKASKQDGNSHNSYENPTVFFQKLTGDVKIYMEVPGTQNN